MDFTAPIHVTKISFPCSPMVNEDEGERWGAFPPENPGSRYEALPLIMDPRVVENSNFSKFSEMEFFTIHQASSIVPLPAQGTGSVTSDTSSAWLPWQLVHDLHEIQKVAGHTDLLAVQYSIEHDDEIEGPLLRIRLESIFYNLDGSLSPVHTRNYETDFDDLAQVLHDADRSCCKLDTLQMLVHVFTGASDRAVRLVNYLCEGNPSSGLHRAEDWKPRRTINYMKLVDAAVTAVPCESLEDDALCGICVEKYRTPDEPNRGDSSGVSGNQPVRLACGHIFGKECIVRWAEGFEREDELQTQPSDIRCPYRCKTSVIPEHVGKSITFGLRNGIYHYDDQYTAFENFERSCADLDIHPWINEDSLTPIRIKSAVLLKAWEMLFEGAELEETISTPFSMQAHRYQETKIARAAVRDFLSSQDSIFMLTTHLYRRLWRAIEEAVEAHCAGRSYELTTLTGQKTIPASELYWMGMVGFKPGFRPFLNRTISRMIYFQKYRMCNCSPGFHYHGLRLYYNTKGESKPIDPNRGDDFMVVG